MKEMLSWIRLFEAHLLVHVDRSHRETSFFVLGTPKPRDTDDYFPGDFSDDHDDNESGFEDSDVHTESR